MSARVWYQLVAVLVLTVVAASAAVAQTRVVNMIPQGRSGEQNQDSEPTLTIDPSNYSRMAGSAFTWDNLTQSPMVTATAPIYVSLDRGATWALAYIVPSSIGSGFPTGDINLTFGSTLSQSPLQETSWLYGGTLSATSSSFPMTVLRAQDPFDLTTVMSTLDTRTGNVDQPHARALSAIGGSGTGEDKLFVGFNNGYGCGAPNGRTSTIDVTQSASATTPTLALDLIEARNTACQDGFAQVPAPHLDGTVYAAFIHDWNGTPRLVVVRDDAWGASAQPFSALVDPSDGAAGRFVTGTLTIQSGNMGQERLGASNVSIAVDPRDSDRVYVAWGDSNGANSETIHVRRSIDRGKTWSISDLLSVTNAMNPEIAINSLGAVGVLYQRVASSHWETHLDRTTDADATVFDDPGVLLANTDATKPTNTIASSVYVGDYASLISVGKNFFGMFSASNYPDLSTFPSGVTFQRFADWNAHKLYSDAALTTEVPISIDPYFFEVDALAPDQDFYVRDWTTDANHADNGVEPSTNPVFYATSDVWNRRSTLPGTFTNDQPANEDAGNGAGTVGDNWAFARVRRNTAGAATSVTAHFLVSKFGTGSNYVDSTVGDPDVSFPDPDPVIAADTTTGPWLTVPYHWHLNAIAGNHLCLAVEISAPGSPYIPPSLVGETPGWPTTDLRIVNDNHKAQRNMQLSTTPAGSAGSITAYGIVHNAATLARDIPLKIGVSEISKRYIQGATLRDIGTKGRSETAGPGGTLFVRAVQPGENRWVAVTVETAGLPNGASAFVTADDVAGSIVINGFGVGMRAVPLEQAIETTVDIYRGVATRLAAGFHGRASVRDTERELELTPSTYAEFVQRRLIPHLTEDLRRIDAFHGSNVFDLKALLASVSSTASGPELVDRVTSLLNAVDSYLTMDTLAHGDPADIVQMVHWQVQLFRQQPEISQLPCAAKVVDASTRFLHGRETARLSNHVYPLLLQEVSGCLRQAAGDHGDLNGSDLAALERVHRDYLLALAR